MTGLHAGKTRINVKREIRKRKKKKTKIQLTECLASCDSEEADSLQAKLDSGFALCASTAEGDIDDMTIAEKNTG